MKTIAEIFGYDLPEDDNTRFGVEIELEGINKNTGHIAGWVQTHDGSLRDNGREFVFNSPKNLTQSKANLKRLQSVFKEINLKPKATNLTSTHIHIDVRDLNVKQFLNMVAIIMMVEDDLAEASGEDRKNNYFALTTSESVHRLQDLIDVKDDNQFKKFVERCIIRDIRYSGINFSSVGQHGSLEIRYLGGQANPENVIPWLEFYTRVKNLSLQDIDFEELYRNISIEGTEHLNRLLEPNFPLTIENVIEGIRNAQTFILGTEYKVISADYNGNGVHDYYENLI